MSDSQQQAPACPKCGYDQSGEIATWQEQCPMRGLCPECGCEFLWGNLLDPSQVKLTWYVEHGHSKWGLVRRTVPTIWYLLIPNRYWKRVGVDTPIRLSMLLLWWAILFGGLHMVSTFGLLIGAAEFERFNFNRGWLNPQEQPVTFLQNMKNLGSDYWIGQSWESLIHPFHFSVSHLSDLGESAIGLIYIASGCCALWGVVLVVVPTTRRMAKLRFAHVLRAIVLSVLCVSLLYQLGRLLDSAIMISVYTAQTRALYEVGPRIFLALMFIVFLWVQWFWIAAVRTGWKIRPSWILVILGTIASLLGGLIILLMIELYI